MIKERAEWDKQEREALKNLKMTLETEKRKIEDELEGNARSVWITTHYWRGAREEKESWREKLRIYKLIWTSSTRSLIVP